jgi:ribosomal protein S18 acetylase RimI-like enzyme
MIIRAAENKDVDFLVDTIIEAEKSGSDIISYCSIFEIKESFLRKILKEMLQEEVEGQEICTESFMIAEEEGSVIAAIAAWVEEEEEIPSHILKANLLSFYIPKENLLLARKKRELINSTHISREVGALQIESGFVLPNHQGKGVIRQLITAQIERFKDRNLAKAQIIVANNNEKAIMSYKKLGFYRVFEKTNNNNEILSILPAKSNALLEKTF